MRMGPKGFDPLTIGLEVQHSIQAELPAQELFNYTLIISLTLGDVASNPNFSCISSANFIHD